MRFLNLLMLGTSLVTTAAWAGQFNLDQVKAEYAKASKPADTALLGNWYLVGLANPNSGQFDPNGIKAENGQKAWTLVFAVSAQGLAVVSDFYGTVPQSQAVTESADSIGFKHGFDTDLQFVYTCRTNASSVLICVDTTQRLGMEFVRN